MKFRKWLTETSTTDGPDPTREFNPAQLGHDPQQTREYMPDSEYSFGSGTAATDEALSELAEILRRLDPAIPGAQSWQPEIRNPDGSVSSDAFVGTPDYASPEQWEPTRYHQLDNYQSALLRSIPSLFPQLAHEAQRLAQLWANFRNIVVNRLRENAQNPQTQIPNRLRPIYYSVPLIALTNATEVFSDARRVLLNGGTENRDLVSAFSQLFRAHLDLMSKIEKPLKQQLAVARQNPFFGDVSDSEPAASA